MATLRLWSDELESMRPEARAAVEAGKAMFSNRTAREKPGTRDERVARERASVQAGTFPLDQAEVRDLAGVPCRIFRPDGSARAVYLHFHGGGMVTGSAEMMDPPNRHLSSQFGIAVVSVNYRKAPEHPFPAGPDDGYAVAEWLIKHSNDEFGADRILIGGESAGAYLTAVTALRIRDQLHAIDRVDGLNLIFGLFDWSGLPSQRGVQPHGCVDILDPEYLAFAADCYLPGRTAEERRAPEVSPAFADLHGLPPCLVSVGSCDHMLDDSLLFATRAAAAGVDVDLYVAPDMPHVFFSFDCKMTRHWAEYQAHWIEARLPAA
jgi:acetyl esterase/lipase